VDGDKGAYRAFQEVLAPTGTGLFLCSQHRGLAMAKLGKVGSDAWTRIVTAPTEQILFSELGRAPSSVHANLNQINKPGTALRDDSVLFMHSHVKSGEYQLYIKSTQQHVEGDNRHILSARHADPVAQLVQLDGDVLGESARARERSAHDERHGGLQVRESTGPTRGTPCPRVGRGGP
jgi:hypothetical protein